MRAITPELETLLKSKLQAGPDGFRARVEIDYVPPPAAPGTVDDAWAAYSASPSQFDIPWTPAVGSQLLVFITARNDGTDEVRTNDGTGALWTPLEVGYTKFASAFTTTAVGDETVVWWNGGGSNWPGAYAIIIGIADAAEITISDASAIGAGSATPTGPSVVMPSEGIVFGFFNQAEDQYYDLDPFVLGAGEGWTVVRSRTVENPSERLGPHPIVVMRRVEAGTWAPTATSDVSWAPWYMITVGVTWGGGEGGDGSAIPIAYVPSRISIDKSLRMTADQAEVTIPNEELAIGWFEGEDSIPTNSRIRIWQWYGDRANEVLSFTGVIDRVTNQRDVLTTTVSARDMMAILLDQTFGATAPQGADETGATRTAANGVYLSMEVSAIVEDILDRAGWPVADRAVEPTSYVLDEFIIPDGTSWAAAIIGDEQLSGLVGYVAFADEAGVFHFEPSFAEGSLTDPGTPAWTFRAGEDITSLDDSVDQYDLRTRVKIRGPLTTTTLTDTWRELWRTAKISHPVGIWYDPADSANIRVLDRVTKRLYKLRQSDRVVLSSTYLGTVIPYPLGVSGDPSDATIYWVLSGPWLWGSGTASSIKKVRKADNVVLSSWNLDTDHWSSIKVSGSYIYVANLTDDAIYRRSKTDGTAVDHFHHTYGGTLQLNPSGVMIDGTTIYVFWSNSGTTARFLKCAEAAPGTVTGAVRTAGTVLVGGEMDTTTHTECWGGSDSLHRVAKFTLVAVSSMTEEVFAEVVDTALEDELGSLAQSENREHDTHPADPDHAYEIRRDTLDLSVITSLAQATETAMRRLDMLSRRREVLDVGILGNPALQKTDLVRVEDPTTGIASDWTIDTHRSEMGDTYLGTMALLPLVMPDETPTDDGDAT